MAANVVKAMDYSIAQQTHSRTFILVSHLLSLLLLIVLYKKTTW